VLKYGVTLSESKKLCFVVWQNGLIDYHIVVPIELLLHEKVLLDYSTDGSVHKIVFELSIHEIVSEIADWMFD